MRRLLATALIVLGLPLTASAGEDCATGTFDWATGTPEWGSTHVAGQINTEVVGRFLWVQIDEGEVFSIPLDGTEAAATVCATGTTFTHTARVVVEQPMICDCQPAEYVRFIEPSLFSIH